jgi:prophage regulatory protein
MLAKDVARTRLVPFLVLRNKEVLYGVSGPAGFKNLERFSKTSTAGRTTMTVSDEKNSFAWPNDGFVRLSSILAPTGPLPISRSAWWAGVASGRYPKSVKLGPRITAWRVNDLRALIDNAR